MDLNIFSNCLNCDRMVLPFKYLEITIGGNHRRVEFWKPIIHKIQSRLSTLKSKLLSITGRLCLVMSVIFFLFQGS